MIRVGTRGSALALVQAATVRDRLVAQGLASELVTIRTEGDRRLDTRLADIGGKGLFVQELETALLDGRVDVAVHSLKDLPADVADGLTLAAYLAREDPRDVLVTRSGGGLDALPPGAHVGTSSPRRSALLRAMRPDLAIDTLRGNVDTRLRKLAEGPLDAIVLAAAGVRRLGLSLPRATPLDPDVFVPAVGQGIIVAEARQDDPAILRSLSALDDAAARDAAHAERGFLARLGASCATPIAAHATVADRRVRIAGLVAREDGAEILRGTREGDRAHAAALGRVLAEDLLARGAASITALHPEVSR